MNTIIKPLQIAKRQFDSNLIQGPLAGYSCASMRQLTWRYSQPAYCATEMISANQLVYTQKTHRRFLFRAPEEKALCYQLAVTKSNILIQSLQILNDYQPDIVEINCGCPVTKMRRKGMGSGLLQTPEKIAELIRLGKDHTDAAISIKIRIANDQCDQDDIAIAQQAEAAGADMIVVHGRHWTERYDTPCRLDTIARIVSAVSIPVIGNGDVEDCSSLKNMIEQTDCAGIMIARAALGQPWLFEQLRCELLGQQFNKPSHEEIGELFLEHVKDLTHFIPIQQAIYHARKLGKYYARGSTSLKALQDELNVCEDFLTLEKIVRRHFQSSHALTAAG